MVIRIYVLSHPVTEVLQGYLLNVYIHYLLTPFLATNTNFNTIKKVGSKTVNYNTSESIQRAVRPLEIP